jgi:acyl phosphate:glycerol-3-phosphate acyltransferase
MISKVLFLPPIAYLIGSVPFGIILTRLFRDIDIRELGSKNIGAYNVFRLTGIKLGLITLAGDLLKGAVPVLISLCWVEISGWRGDLWVSIVALSAFAGHIFSIFLGFKGGKGVATAAGCFLVLAPLAFLVCLLVYLVVVCSFGYSSAGSLSAATVLPLGVWVTSHSVPLTGCAVIMAIGIFLRHSDNIKRLVEGTENSRLRF